MSRLVAHHILTQEEISAITRDFVRRGLYGHAIRFRTQIVTGVRSGEDNRVEIASCRIEDLNRHPGRLLVREQKGGGHRTAIFCDGGTQSPTYKDLIAWAQMRGLRRGPLFSTGYHAFWEALHSAAVNVGAQEVLGRRSNGDAIYRVRPHALKHTWVYLARKAGIGWDVICKTGFKAGLRALPTVLRYYAFLDLEDALDEVQSCPITL